MAVAGSLRDRACMGIKVSSVSHVPGKVHTVHSPLA